MMKKSVFYCGLVLVGLGLGLGVGCAEEEAEPNGQESSYEGKKYEQVKGEGKVYRQVSACELFSRPGPVGVFTVDSITGTYAPATGPRIHVELAQETLLEGTLPNPFTFSFSGGEDDTGIALSPQLSATVGERVVLLVHEHEVAELTVETELQIFREIAPDRFSNGQLFAEDGLSIAEIEGIVQQVRGSTVCPLAEGFGFEQASSQGAGDIEEGEATIVSD